jgi:hypothetical protein
MKTKAYLIILPLAAALALSCTREIIDPATETAAVAAETGDQEVLVPFTVEAGAPETRVAVSGSTTNIVFSEGDQLMVYFFQLVEPSILTLKSGAGQRSATFTGYLTLAAGKTEADLAGKRLYAILIPAAGVSSGVFTYDPSTKKLSVDYSAGAIDSDLEALVSRTILYQGETTYEARMFSFRMLNSYVKMDVTVPSEESALARDYTVSVTNDWHICAKATCSRSGWSATGESSSVSGTFTASSSTKGTLYMSVLADNMVRVTDDGAQYDQVDFSIAMDNVYKEYDLQGGSISKAIIEPGKGYAKAVTLTDNPDQDVLLGQPTSVRDNILFLGDLNNNDYLSKYEAAQLKYVTLTSNTDLTNASFFNYFTGFTSLPNRTFMGCTNLTKVILPPHITEIGEAAFMFCEGISQDIYIPKGVTSIKRDAFYECTSLPRIVIPSGVTTIEEHAFSACSALKEVIFETPVLVTSIGTAAFANCTSLEEIAIPSPLTAIQDRTFESCSSLKSVSMSFGLTSIGTRAFVACHALEDVWIPQSVTSIGEYAFCNSGIKTIRLPNRLTAIEASTFSGCTSLQAIEIPPTVKLIGKQAFFECSTLETVSIPSLVERMGSRAFGFCSKLATVYCYPTEPPKAIELNESNFFYRCNSALVIYVPSGCVSTYRVHHDWSEWNRILQAM